MRSSLTCTRRSPSSIAFEVGTTRVLRLSVGIAHPQREVCPFQPLDIRDMTTDEAVEKVAAALRQMGVEEDGGGED